MKIGSSYLQQFQSLSQFAQSRNDDGVLDGMSSDPDQVVVRGANDSYNNGSIDMEFQAKLQDGEVKSIETYRKGTSSHDANGKLAGHWDDWFPEEVNVSFEDRGTKLAVKESWLRGSKNGWKSDERPAHGEQRSFLVDKETHEVSHVREKKISKMLRGFNDGRQALKNLGSELRGMTRLATDSFDAMKNRVTRSYVAPSGETAEEYSIRGHFREVGPQMLTPDDLDDQMHELHDIAKRANMDVVNVDLKGLDDAKALESALWGENHEMVLFSNVDEASPKVQRALSRAAKEHDYSPWFVLAEPGAEPVKGFKTHDHSV